MALIDNAKKLLLRLWQEDKEWQTFFSKHGWNYSTAELNAMSPEVLQAHLLEEIPINRSIQGFEDFSLTGNKMIEPGHPTRSLLYHALASPNVYYLEENSAAHLQVFATLSELDSLENFIYSLIPLDIDSLIQREGIANVAIAVFSYEYRQAINTTHRMHADFCFSRTGVARVGTDGCKYEPDLRAFTTFLDFPGQKGMRVSPARYGAFIAVRRTINNQELSVLPYLGSDKDGSDTALNRAFWVPVHKLFPGSRCLSNQLNLALSYIDHHENLKLKKVCEYINQTANRDLDEKPYTITEGLVEMLNFSDDDSDRAASMWVAPVPHPLVEEALNQRGERVTITVPPDPENRYFAALTLRDDGGARSAPEYVNVRKTLGPRGEVIDLNNEPNVDELVARGNYEAIMHIDYTCDGWILAVCPGLALKSIPAYSLVTAPDFIPYAEQRELIEWDVAISKNYWALEPWALSDSSLAFLLFEVDRRWLSGYGWCYQKYLLRMANF